MDLEEIKIREINVFLELIRVGSVRELARQRNTQAGQISKVLSAMEHKLGFKLVERSPFGVKITAKAKDLLPVFTEIYKNQETFRANFNTREQPVMGFATTSFFSTHFLPKVFSACQTKYPEYKLRLLDLPPDLFLPVALRNGFQICLHQNELDWPKTWTSARVGDVRWILCARKNHPVLSQLSVKNIVKYPFIYPVYWSHDGLAYGNDNFPKSLDQRIRGHETTTAASAVEIIRLTDQLGFVPEIVARPLVERGQLVELNVPSLEKVKKPFYLSVKNDFVSQKMFLWLAELCKKEFSL